LKTADGFRWKFTGTNDQGVLLVSRLECLMGISLPTAETFTAPSAMQVKNISVHVLKSETQWRDLPKEHANEFVFRVGPVSTPQKMAFQLTRISQVVAHSSEKNGGLLVHGALAERNGVGVILAGPGGVGKTTASKRLPRPWRSMSDDNTLIVRSPDGTYWAHPWPTWSRFRRGDMSGSWDVQAAVKLDLICMLSQAGKDFLFPLPIRQIISELVDVSGQTFFIMANGMDKGAIRRINLMRFQNAMTISKKVPICRLEISKSSKFWKEIEKFLVSLR
jgi:SynChlorMet cassette protein ScmC